MYRSVCEIKQYDWEYFNEVVAQGRQSVAPNSGEAAYWDWLEDLNDRTMSRIAAQYGCSLPPTIALEDFAAENQPHRSYQSYQRGEHR